MSFERETDQVRVKAVLDKFPNVKVITVCEIKFPTSRVPEILGLLYEFHPTRYEHVECEFLSLRGIRKVNRKLILDGLSSEGFLDYQWLQPDYFKERYGLNWLYKIKLLFRAKMTTFYLPNDKKRNVNEMFHNFNVTGFAASITIHVFILGASEVFEKNPLLVSDRFISGQLAKLGRDPEGQVQSFLDLDESCFVFTTCSTLSYSFLLPQESMNIPLKRFCLYNEDIFASSCHQPPKQDLAKQRSKRGCHQLPEPAEKRSCHQPPKQRPAKQRIKKGCHQLPEQEPAEQHQLAENQDCLSNTKKVAVSNLKRNLEAFITSIDHECDRRNCSFNSSVFERYL